jgi:hypothetical protein
MMNGNKSAGSASNRKTAQELPMRYHPYILAVLVVAAIAPFACRHAEHPAKVPEDVSRPVAAAVPATQPAAARNAVDPVRIAWDFVVAKEADRELDRASGRIVTEDGVSWHVSFNSPTAEAAGRWPREAIYRVDKQTFAVSAIPID